MPTIKKPVRHNAPEHGTEADSIDNLVLQDRAHGGLRAALFNAGIAGEAATIAAAMAIGDDQIMRSPNVGRKSVRDIRAEIDRYLGH
jgi:hypothetical protein